MTIDTILFDVGGVIFTLLDKEAAVARRTQLARRLGHSDAAAMWRRFYTGSEWAAAKTGHITEAQMWDQLLSPHGLDESEQAAFVQELFADEGVDPAMEALIASLHGRYQLGILSNASDKLEYLLQQVGIFAYFDEVINSHRIGVAKPHQEAYEKALKRLGAVPEQVYFIDDQARNTRVADMMGMTCHVFTEMALLTADLTRLSLL